MITSRWRKVQRRVISDREDNKKYRNDEDEQDLDIDKDKDKDKNGDASEQTDEEDMPETPFEDSRVGVQRMEAVTFPGLRTLSLGICEADERKCKEHLLKGWRNVHWPSIENVPQIR